MNKYIKLPGLIDIHVHLRDPGQTHKEDFHSGSVAALAGGITTVFDMPNNLKPVFTKHVLEEKLEIAAQKSACNFGLYFGTNGENISEFEGIYDKVVGLKVYLSETTGKYTVTDEEKIQKIFASWICPKPIVVHAEGKKADLAIKYARDFKRKLHVAHVSTAEELDQVLEAKKSGMPISCEVTPHHLFLTDKDLDRLKGYGLVKPPLATRKDQDYLWAHINEIDCVASDHAPHTMEEKESDTKYFGMPGLETLLPLLLTAVHEGRMCMDDIVRMTNTNPQRIFDFKQNEGNIVEVDPEFEFEIKNENLKTKSGWSPFEGKTLNGKITNVQVKL
jgi:dihydroorotase